MFFVYATDNIHLFDNSGNYSYGSNIFKNDPNSYYAFALTFPNSDDYGLIYEDLHSIPTLLLQKNVIQKKHDFVVSEDDQDLIVNTLIEDRKNGQLEKNRILLFFSKEPLAFSNIRQSNYIKYAIRLNLYNIPMGNYAVHVQRYMKHVVHYGDTGSWEKDRLFFDLPHITNLKYLEELTSKDNLDQYERENTFDTNRKLREELDLILQNKTDNPDVDLYFTGKTLTGEEIKNLEKNGCNVYRLNSNFTYLHQAHKLKIKNQRILYFKEDEKNIISNLLKQCIQQFIIIDPHRNLSVREMNALDLTIYESNFDRRNVQEAEQLKFMENETLQTKEQKNFLFKLCQENKADYARLQNKICVVLSYENPKTPQDVLSIFTVSSSYFDNKYLKYTLEIPFQQSEWKKIDFLDQQLSIFQQDIRNHKENIEDLIKYPLLFERKILMTIFYEDLNPDTREFAIRNGFTTTRCYQETLIRQLKVDFVHLSEYFEKKEMFEQMGKDIAHYKNKILEGQEKYLHVENIKERNGQYISISNLYFDFSNLQANKNIYYFLQMDNYIQEFRNEMVKKAVTDLTFQTTFLFHKYMKSPYAKSKNYAQFVEDRYSEKNNAHPTIVGMFHQAYDYAFSKMLTTGDYTFDFFDSQINYLNPKDYMTENYIDKNVEKIKQHKLSVEKSLNELCLYLEKYKTDIKEILKPIQNEKTEYIPTVTILEKRVQNLKDLWEIKKRNYEMTIPNCKELMDDISNVLVRLKEDPAETMQQLEKYKIQEDITMTIENIQKNIQVYLKAKKNESLFQQYFNGMKRKQQYQAYLNQIDYNIKQLTKAYKTDNIFFYYELLIQSDEIYESLE